MKIIHFDTYMKIKYSVSITASESCYGSVKETAQENSASRVTLKYLFYKVT